MGFVFVLANAVARSLSLIHKSNKYDLLLFSVVHGMTTYIDKAIVCDHTQEDLDKIIRMMVQDKEVGHLNYESFRNSIG